MSCAESRSGSRVSGSISGGSPTIQRAGMFGGHDAAITTTGRPRAIASIHGDNADGSVRMAVALARKAASRG